MSIVKHYLINMFGTENFFPTQTGSYYISGRKSQKCLSFLTITKTPFIFYDGISNYPRRIFARVRVQEDKKISGSNLVNGFLDLNLEQRNEIVMLSAWWVLDFCFY